MPEPPVRPLHHVGSPADTPQMLVIYVETCPDCACPLARSSDGEPHATSRLAAACDGCACHVEYPIAAGS